MGREGIIERERRWAVPAAVGAFAAGLLFVLAAVVLQSAHAYSGPSEAQQFLSQHDHAGTLLLAAVIASLGFLALVPPFLYLFRAAEARNPRVRPGMVGLVFIGPVLIAAVNLVQSVGLNQVASDFAAKSTSERSVPYAKFQGQLKRDPNSIEKVTIYTVPNSLEVQQTDGSFYEVKSYPDTAESGLPTRLDDAQVDHATDSDTGTGPPDALAIHLASDNGLLGANAFMTYAAVLSLIVITIYVSLQALRVGLLTRFAGSLGIALGAAFIFIPPITLLGALFWAVYLGYAGMTFLGRTRGGRPPAWDAGKAIPLPRAGERPTTGGEDSIEGEATEVDGDGDRAAGDFSESAPQPQKRKRKRRS